MKIRAQPSARVLAFHFSPFFSFCHVFRSDSPSTLPLAPTIFSLFFFFFFFFFSFLFSFCPRLLLYYRFCLRSLRRVTLTKTHGCRVIRRGTCWRKQSQRVNTEVEWTTNCKLGEHRFRWSVISIVDDWLDIYLLPYRSVLYVNELFTIVIRYSFSRKWQLASAEQFVLHLVIISCIELLNYQ